MIEGLHNSGGRKDGAKDMTRESRELRQRVVKLVLSIGLVLMSGTLGYRWLTHLGWLDSLYQTVVVVTTLGMDVLDISHTSTSWQVKIFTILLIFSGASVAAYAFTTLTTIVVEGELGELLGRRRMDRDIARLSDHYIVCGAGRTGLHIVRELVKTKRPFVVIDKEEREVREAMTLGPVLYMVGDATEEKVLIAAGLDRAAGLMATLANDRDNLYLVVTARHMNPTIRIIARGFELTAEDKLKRAGANSVVSPNLIGGLRMVSVMVRPAVVSFLDQMLRDTQHQMRFEEVRIHEGNKIIGRTIEQSRIREKTGLLVIACVLGENDFVYNPNADTVIQPGMALVVLGDTEQISRLHAYLDEPEVSHPHGVGAITKMLEKGKGG